MKNIFSKGIMPAVTIADESKAQKIAETILEAGLDVMEIPLRTKSAYKAIEIISTKVPEMKLGAGTILTTTQVNDAINAGATFGLAPGFNPKIVAEAQRKSMLFVPGVMSPSEVELAYEMGCKLLKLFPAENVGGIKMLKALNGPYGHLGLQYIPMGGVNVGNMSQYLEISNVLAIGGSWLATKELISENNFDQIKQNVMDAINKSQRKK